MTFHINKDANLHYQVFIDVDSNKQTGYYEPWIPNAGAEYLLEDNVLFKYAGTGGSHDWNWEVINYQISDGKLIDAESGEKIDISEANSYGVLLEKNWEYKNFLGYRHMYDNLSSVQYTPVHEEPHHLGNVFSYKNDKNFYVKMPTIENVSYYNCKFEVGGKKFSTEGSTLFDANGNNLTDDLVYEADIEAYKHSALTILPKQLVGDGSLKITSIEFRDSNWGLVGKYNGNSDTPPQQGKYVNTKKTSTFVRNGENITSIHYYDYNNKGNITLAKYDRNADDVIDDTTKYSYKYDNSGHIISKITTYQNGSTSETTYTYDENGLLVSKIESTSKTTYTYNENGKIIEEKSFSHDEINHIINYTYDENNNRVTMQAFDAFLDQNGVLVKEIELDEKYTYNDKNQRIRLEGSYNDANDADDRYTYDENGRLIETRSLGYDDDGQTHKITYTYDENGNLISEKDDANMDGSVEYETTYSWKKL